MIEVSRNSIVIRNVDFESEEYKRFFKAFSLYDQVTHKYNNNIFTIINNDVYIPASITEEVVSGFFPKEVIKS